MCAVYIYIMKQFQFVKQTSDDGLIRQALYKISLIDLVKDKC